MNPPRSLDRIDQPSLPLDNVFEYEWDGSGVELYILDSGIRSTHKDFVGRSECIFNAFSSRFDSGPPDCSDNDNHGSHVAGTAAGVEVRRHDCQARLSLFSRSVR